MALLQYTHKLCYDLKASREEAENHVSESNKTDNGQSIHTQQEKSDPNTPLIPENKGPAIEDKCRSKVQVWKTSIGEEETTIPDLDKMAGRILKELTKYSSVKQEIEKKSKADKLILRQMDAETIGDDDLEYHQNRAGSLASKECVGNTPFLVVYKGKGRELSMRRGFEVCRPKDYESKEITDVEMELKDLPGRYYHSGEYYDNKGDRPGSLLSLVDNDRKLAKNYSSTSISMRRSINHSFLTDLFRQRRERPVSSSGFRRIVLKANSKFRKETKTFGYVHWFLF